MNNNRKMISIGIITVLMFFVSFILLFNDIINYFIISCSATTVLFAYCCCLVFSKKDEKTLYDKRLKKILKTYDSILVYSNDDFEFGGENIIFVKKFDNLLIAQDELNIPIVYIEEKQSSVFLLKDGKELLVYVDKVNDDIDSKCENRLRYLAQNKDEKNDIDSNILENLEKTTIIQLKNNKVYKVSPLKSE